MIYLDNNATTKIYPQVIEAMMQVYKAPANPSSVYKYGRQAKAILENARKNIAKLIKFDFVQFC